MKNPLSRPLRYTAVVTAVAVVASLTSCSSSGSKSGSSSGGSGGSSAASKSVLIGLSSVLSGPYAAYSDFSEGEKMYFQTINQAGGANGYQIKYVEEDNAFTAAQAVQVAKDLKAKKVFAIMEAGTPPVQATKNIADSLDLPILAAADGDLFTPPLAKVYGLNPRYTQLAVFDAQFIMKTLNISNFALAYENDAVGIPAQTKVPPYVTKNNGKLLASVPVDATATDFSAQALRLKQSGATAVQAFMGTTIFAGLQKAATAIGYNPKWITFDTQLTPAYLNLVGSMSNGVYVDSYLDQTGAPLQAYQTAAAKYNSKLTTSFLGQLGWTLAAVLVGAIKTATAGGKSLTQSTFIDAMNNFNGAAAGLLPAVNFTSQSHAASKKATIYQYGDNGTIKQVIPFQDLPSV